jgi:soluble lytic murein transglycosylase-like protein
MKYIIIISLFFTLALSEENENYYVSAGKAFNLEPWILWSIGKTESNHNPYAINRNTNGTYDVGVMQINSIHFARLKKQYGLEKEDLLNPKISIYVGASILKECFNKYGNSINAINCYNGLNYDNRVNNTYAKKVYKNYLSGQERYANR